MDSAEDTARAVGCPIRTFSVQSLLATPRNLSQRATSFIASQCQGIHQMPLLRLITASNTWLEALSSKFRHTQGQNPCSQACNLLRTKPLAGKQPLASCEDTNCADHELLFRFRLDKLTLARKPADKTHGSHRPFGSHISTMRNSQQITRFEPQARRRGN